MRRSLRDETSKYAVLADPKRREVYLHVRRSPEGLTKDGAAESLGISRTLASFHLERLLEAGLVHARFARSTTRPEGAGRPAKHYCASDVDIAVTIPERRYQVAAEILSQAVLATSGGGSPVQASMEVARDRGREIGDSFARELGVRPSRGVSRAQLAALLEEMGYEPRQGPREITLANCPFDALVEPPFLVCDVNRELLHGALEGSRAKFIAQERYMDDQCCVVLRPKEAQTGGQ